MMVLVFAMLVFASGCDEPQVTEDDGGSDDTSADGSSGEGDDGEEEETTFTEYGGSSSGSEEKSEETEEELGSDDIPIICDVTNCAAPGVCYEGKCVTAECVTDADCVNDDPCRSDVCEFAGHPNAFCSTDVITKPKNGDGCCPRGEELDTDTDCSPVCGNGKCEVDENAENCKSDCEHAGSSGGAAPSGGYSGPTAG
jgi:hypothetical protein